MRPKNWVWTFMLLFLQAAVSQVLQFEEQMITVTDFESEGFILDIGGGGEGAIARLKGSQVVVIDILKSELLKVPDGPLKILMEAKDLQFMDWSFQTVTVFFKWLHFSIRDHEKIFREVFRVLKPGGVFRIWDAEIPKSRDSSQNRAVLPLKILLPDQIIQSGYGVMRPPNNCDLDYYIKLATKCGFAVQSRESSSRVFNLVLQKPVR